MIIRLKGFSKRSQPCLLAVGVLVAATLPLLNGDVSAVESVAIPVSQSTCVDCASPEYCPPGDHDAWNNPGSAPWHRNGGAHSFENPCFSGTCDVMHGPFGCTETFPDAMTRSDMETLRLAVHRSDVVGISRILANHADQVRLNRTRAAIQVATCNGSISVHLPVSAGLMRSLE